jgi:adenine-specific DNA methylase
LLAVVTIRAGINGRRYREPTPRDLEAYRTADVLLKERWSGGVADLPAVPTDELPLMSGVFNVPIYGHTTWASLFNARQLRLSSFRIL